ncbi:MAG: hypothetical protein NT007_18890 [Candidatus Kapabacteria bacterium]|nr:hypothetical protein [Candidatus Kapabacteria bacterium]
MTASELITQFVDGELSTSHESELFSALMVNEDLRKELHEQMAIHDSVRIDTEAFNPPQQATRDLFAELGFTAPNPSFLKKGAMAAASAVGRFSIMKKISIPALAVLVSTLLTFWASSEYYTNKYENMAQNNFQNTNQKDLTTTVSKAAPIPVVSTSVVEKSNNLNNNLKRIPKAVNKIFAAISENDANDNNSISPVEASIANDELVTNTTVITENQNNSSITLINSSKEFASNIPTELKQTNIAPEHQFAPMILAFNKSKSWFVEINRINPVYSSTAISTPYANSSIENISLAIFYKVKNNLLVGIMGGYEAFGQNIPVTRPNQPVSHNPLLAWGGIAARYMIDDFKFYGFKPFAQATIGVTGGPFGKISGGLEYNLFNFVDVIGSAEGAVLLYRPSDKYLTSNKIAFNLGLNFHL